MVCDVTTRLAMLLGYLSLDAMSDQESLEPPVGLSVSLTQEQMVSMIGSCQQTINETLKSFEEKGMIKMKKRRIILLNPLFALCGFVS
jgi:CRP-like cAMP-binding protein